VITRDEQYTIEDFALVAQEVEESVIIAKAANVANEEQSRRFSCDLKLLIPTPLEVEVKHNLTSWFSFCCRRGAIAFFDDESNGGWISVL
jgi:hypothetical protein